MRLQSASPKEIASLEQLRISERQLRELPEYSLTMPTGVYLGKLWRQQLANGRWIVRGYLASPDPEKASIMAWRPLITVQDQQFIKDCKAQYDADVKARR